MPGFGLSLDFACFSISLILVLIPLAAVFVKTTGHGFGTVLDVVTSPRLLRVLPDAVVGAR